jgi:hypothetical protein
MGLTGGCSVSPCQLRAFLPVDRYALAGIVKRAPAPFLTRLVVQLQLIAAPGIDPTSASRIRATVEEGNAPNLDLPKDAYFDASDIALDIQTRKPRGALSTRVLQPDPGTHGWSSALFLTKPAKANGSFTSEQNGDRAAEEPCLSGPAAVVPDTSKAPIDSLFVPRLSERRPQ